MGSVQARFAMDSRDFCSFRNAQGLPVCHEKTLDDTRTNTYRCHGPGRLPVCREYQECLRGARPGTLYGCYCTSLAAEITLGKYSTV